MKRSFSLFLLPGFDGTGELFRPLQSELDATISTRVCRYTAEESFDDYVATAAAMLPLENAVLLAESFSGPVALGPYDEISRSHRMRSTLRDICGKSISITHIRGSHSANEPVSSDFPAAPRDKALLSKRGERRSTDRVSSGRKPFTGRVNDPEASATAGGY